MLATAHEPSKQYQYTTYISTYVNGGRTRSEQQAIFNDMQQQQNDMLQQVNDCINNNDTPSLAEQEYDIDKRINLLRRQQQQQQQSTRSSNNSSSNKKRRSSWSILENISSFIEDITTCCWHVDLICGLDNDEEEAILNRQKAKENRKNGIDDTFMGKVISCAPLSSCGGHNSCTGAVRGVVVDDDTTIATTPSSVSQCLDES